MWGAGCVVYFLLTSLNPFLSENDKSPTAAVEKYTFPDWPRRSLSWFQICENTPFKGGQILVREATFEANDFLSKMIVRSPSRRISVYAALQHPWICNTTPLESALRQGDIPLSRRLAGRDPRYGKTWADPLPIDVIHVILRFAAANGHAGLLAHVLQQHLRRTYGFPEPLHWPHLVDWPNTSHSLIGAAKSGHVGIVNRLLQCPWFHSRERSGEVLFQALQASIQAVTGTSILFYYPLFSLASLVPMNGVDWSLVTWISRLSSPPSSGTRRNPQLNPGWSALTSTASVIGFSSRQC